MSTQTEGIPIVVYNPLNIEREDLVEADVHFPGSMPASVSVTGPDGHAVPAQISNGRVIFAARVPSVGYAVYSVQPGRAPDTQAGALRVSQDSLENQYYRVRVDSNGDIASIFDKQLGKELLAAPMRLAISYDNPEQWPAWNMDWDQEQAPPKEYVSGPVTARIVENGPARVALEITRETAGSKFSQTIRLSTGDAGKRVEVANAIDWNTRESNLKAVFPLTAHDQMATYNLGIGTVQRPNARPKKFEVLSHQWIDLTDASRAFGTTILTDCKNGSDKPNDNTIRLTLIRTPGTRGGYHDQGTQDLGHHEFVFGIAGHAGDWRQAQTDWQGQRLNDPLIAFQTEKHAGNLGRSVVAGQDQQSAHSHHGSEEGGTERRSCAASGGTRRQAAARCAHPFCRPDSFGARGERTGTAGWSCRSEGRQPGGIVHGVSAADVRDRLDAPADHVAAVHSQPVSLQYDLAAASTDGSPVSGGFDGKGNALPAEMLPQTLHFEGVDFHLAPAQNGTPDALIANGQSIHLPPGQYNRAYILAAAIDGDQKADFQVGDRTTTLNIEDWGGFIGQWDDRQWQAGDVMAPARPGRPARTEHDDYAEMTGIRPGYIKRASLAWYCSHHHDASGKNVAYSYSYLFGYSIDLPAGARTITLPNNEKVRILAISVAQENPAIHPARPLYDTLGRSEPGAVVQP